jgi:hypothetical protein
MTLHNAAAQAESEEIRSRHETDRAVLLAEAQQRCAAAEAAAAAAQDAARAAEVAHQQETAELRRRLVALHSEPNL